MRRNSCALWRMISQTSESSPQGSLVLTEPLEGSAKEVCDIALDLLAFDLPACLREVPVFVGQYFRQCGAEVLPFVDQLIQDTRVGMLRGEAQAEHLGAHTRHFLND